MQIEFLLYLPAHTLFFRMQIYYLWLKSLKEDLISIFTAYFCCLSSQCLFFDTVFL